MPNKEMVVLAVQSFLSVLLLVGALYLSVTGVEVPTWLVNLVVFTIGFWFAGSAVFRVRNNRRDAALPSMRIRQRPDGMWEQVDGN